MNLFGYTCVCSVCVCIVVHRLHVLTIHVHSVHVCGSGMCGEKGARVAESQRSPGKCYSALCGYRATLSREGS